MGQYELGQRASEAWLGRQDDPFVTLTLTASTDTSSSRQRSLPCGCFSELFSVTSSGSAMHSKRNTI